MWVNISRPSGTFFAKDSGHGMNDSLPSLLSLVGWLQICPEVADNLSNEWMKEERSLNSFSSQFVINKLSFIHSFMMHSIRMEKMQWSTWNLLKCVRFFWVFGYLKKNSFKRLWEIIMGTDDEMNLFLVLRLKSCLKQVQTSRTCWRGGGGMGRWGWLGEVIWVQTWHNVQRAENSVFPCRNSC